MTTTTTKRTAEWASRWALSPLAMTESAYHLSLGPISRRVSSKAKVHLPISSHMAVTAAALLSCASSARTYE